MILIQHRRNTIAELRATDTDFGIEVDIRSHGDKLIIHHDALTDGEDFDAWLDAYSHRMLILNVKEEGLEEALLCRMAARGIEDFFFLDQSFPFLIKYAGQCAGRCAVRVSEYESIDTALALAGKVKWIWVDCFTRFPLSLTQAQALKDAGFRLCLVSPELQGRPQPEEIASIRATMKKYGIAADAVCTKKPDLWR